MMKLTPIGVVLGLVLGVLCGTWTYEWLKDISNASAQEVGSTWFDLPKGEELISATFDRNGELVLLSCTRRPVESSERRHCTLRRMGDGYNATIHIVEQ